MDKIIVLGSGAAVAGLHHENTHLLFLAGGRTILVDCPGSPITRLQLAGQDPLALTDLVLTHFHPDHFSGVPLLLVDLWLLGRSQPLDVYALPVTLEKFEKNMDLYGWRNWPNFFEVRLHSADPSGRSILLETGLIRLSSEPVCHLIPTIGVRMDHISSGKSVAYSCDTEPCQAVVSLAAGVDILFHEAAGVGKGHTSPAQAGETAARAGARSLYLIHYPPAVDPAAWLAQASQQFSGEVFMAEDFMEIQID